MAETRYITPITNRTREDIEYAKANQNDLEHKNRGAWNYTDANRVCNNLKYAAEHMYEEGFLTEPYPIQIKTDWTEDDSITYEQLNTMIVNNMNNLKTYSRVDLPWYPIASIANMDFNLANWLEINIHNLATQEPIPPDMFTLTVTNGLGSGIYEVGTLITVYANSYDDITFSYWSGNHLEYLDNVHSAIATFTMPRDNATLEAHYAGINAHTLTVITNSGTDEVLLDMGDTYAIEADPAPMGKVFNNWKVDPDKYERNLREPAATTLFTMPNEDTTLTAVYITKGQKYLQIEDGEGSGYYDYGTLVPIHVNVPEGYEFVTWAGDTQYLTEDITSNYNAVRIPDVAAIKLRAIYRVIPTPTPTPTPTPGPSPDETYTVTVTNGVIRDSGGSSTGIYQKGDRLYIIANSPPDGMAIETILVNGAKTIDLTYDPIARVIIEVENTDATVIVKYRAIELYSFTETIYDGFVSHDFVTRTYTYDRYAEVHIFTSIPEGYEFDRWIGDENSLRGIDPTKNSQDFYMGNTSRSITATFKSLPLYTVTANTYTRTETYTAYEGEQITIISPYPAPEGYTVKEGSYPSADSSSGLYRIYVHDNYTFTAEYRPLERSTLTVEFLDGTRTYTELEGTTMTITAPDVEGKIFKYWELYRSGSSSYSKITEKVTEYTFSRYDRELIPIYNNLWSVEVVNGIIENSQDNPKICEEGSTITIKSNKLEVDELIEWSCSGPGSIANPASPSTKFTVGDGNAIVTAEITKRPDRDKVLTIKMRDPYYPDSEDIVISEETYSYGSKIEITAPVAPDRTTFLSWLGDVNSVSPSALASTIVINSLVTDVTLIATYFYPESPEYYVLNIIGGTPQEGQYTAGTQVPVYANDPGEGWEFYSWYGDTQYFVNPDLTSPNNSIIMPAKNISLSTKYNQIGETPLFRVSVTNGVASYTYTTGEGEEEEEHTVAGVYVDVPEGTYITLTANTDVVGWKFSYWDGNFEDVGVRYFNKMNNPAVFTMVTNDVNAIAVRSELNKYTTYMTNATGPGTVYPGTYPIAGNLRNTDEKHYVFKNWTCRDVNNTNYITLIANPSAIETEVTLYDRDLWITAVYETYYKLTVINGQDTGSGYYAKYDIIDSVTANTPSQGMVFDHWNDPVGVVENIYDETPTIVMKDSVATITAVFITEEAKRNSVSITGSNLHDNEILREETNIISGSLDVGSIIFDDEGCLAIISSLNPDGNVSTDDYGTELLFYGGNI